MSSATINTDTNTVKQLLNEMISNDSFLAFDYPMSEVLSFKAGGKAQVYFEPATLDELTKAIQACTKKQLPVSIIGGGTNVLVSDSGLEGLVISLRRLTGITHTTAGDKVTLVALAGTPTDEVSKYCAEKGIQGFESFAGLPGTIGGAVYMNARCYDKQISDIFSRATTLHGETHEYVAREWGYKLSPFQLPTPTVSLTSERKILVSIEFKLALGDPSLILATRQAHIADREAKGHFTKPSAGSTFKNNRQFGKPSGQIIDEVGLKGFSVGEAQVAPWHGNIVINNGKATASDIKAVIDEVQKRVKEKTGFLLDLEVILAGYFSASSIVNSTSP